MPPSHFSTPVQASIQFYNELNRLLSLQIAASGQNMLLMCTERELQIKFTHRRAGSFSEVVASGVLSLALRRNEEVDTQRVYPGINA